MLPKDPKNIALVILTIFSLPVTAQSFSYDGNRWYEIEVSIFSNEAPELDNETVIPDKTQLAYPEPIRQLIPASSSYMVDFNSTDNDSVAPDFFVDAQDLQEQAVFIGPKNNTGANSFALTDFRSTPFIALGNETARFLEYNVDISQSPDHRLLFHALWRQPVLNRIQSTAVLVEGGNKYAQHHELEGSLRFSYNINRVEVEARLWLSRFTPAIFLADLPWSLPELPYESEIPQGQESDFELSYAVEKLAYMNQERAMISNELHFLDHPDFGMIVEVRPYQLPEQNDFFD